MDKKGLIIVFTGNGKGKTTAAFGVAMRMLGHGKKVAIVQFFKRATISSSLTVARQDALYPAPVGCLLHRQNDGALAAIGKHFGPRLKVWSFGGGFTWRVAREKNIKAVTAAWKKCQELLRDPKYSLLILDEINIALQHKFLKTSEVVKALKKRSASKHVILTGRGAPAALTRAADLVSEMRCIKHPFQNGILAQSGLDF